jgi:glycosyltransferase involved in cell wall biosynthesis
MSLISVIIPTLNRPALLREAIASVMAQTRPADEIIVVDDGSQPPVQEASLKSEFGSLVRVLRNPEPQGLAWVRNQGAMAATGKYVAHLDDDDLFAPETLAECSGLLEADPTLELVFIGVEGFGASSGYFNQVQSSGVARVIEQGRGREIEPSVVLFGKDLLGGLLKQVPSALQHVVARREVWEQVSRLRLKAYQKIAGLASEDEAMGLIRGPLRDSEWALYVGVVCSKTALNNRPRYLARCGGQGTSSLPSNRERHMLQGIGIKTQFYRMARELPELARWRGVIRQSVATAHFDAAYHYFQHGARYKAWSFLRDAFQINPSFSCAKFGVRMLFPRGKADE